MPKEKIVVLVGSASDLPFAHRVEDFLRESRLRVKCEYRISSAHRNMEKLLNDLKSYEQSEEKIVYITMAGLSDALSGVVAGISQHPVIACPPDLEKHGLPKAFSSMMMPQGIAVSLVSTPENAALAAVKILALSDPSLKKHVAEYLDKLKDVVTKADADLRKKAEHEREREHIERIERLEKTEHIEDT